MFSTKHMVYISWESLNSVKQKTYYITILEEKKRTLAPSLTRQLCCKYFLYHAGIVPLDTKCALKYISLVNFMKQKGNLGKKTLSAYCCTGAEDTVVTQYCVTQNPSSEKHICGYAIFHSLRIVPSNNDNKDNPSNRNYGEYQLPICCKFCVIRQKLFTVVFRQSWTKVLGRKHHFRDNPLPLFNVGFFRNNMVTYLA